MRRNKGREIKEAWEGRRAVPHIQSQRGHGAAMFDGGAWSQPAGAGTAGRSGSSRPVGHQTPRDKPVLGRRGDGTVIWMETSRMKGQRLIWLVKHCRTLCGHVFVAGNRCEL